MAYCDYDFYQNRYFGKSIPAEDFPRYAEQASDKLDQITFNRIAEISDEHILTKVNKSVCAIAEILAASDCSEKKVSSMSAGNESISYEKSKYNDAEVNSIDRDIYSMVKMYLTGTGLLYAGY